jgi:peptide-methionine (S)-S-oxide reductase
MRLAAWAVVLSACGAPTLPDDPSLGPEHALPAPALDVPASSDGRLQTAVLAGGCFWSVEAVFESVRGVVDVVSGYAGGTPETARYDLVATGRTDHAEAVEITFDPALVTYGQLLRVFFSAAHDPTQVDQQGPDVGREYRSNIFYASDDQRRVAETYIAQLDASGELPARIATRVDALAAFHWAEDEHQDYVHEHPDDVYVLIVSVPKIRKLGGLFPELYRPPWGLNP